MKPYAQDAENIRLTLVAGIASVDDVVRWADTTLATLDGYDDDLANVSLASSAPPQEIDSMLRQLGQGADRDDAMRHLAGQMHRILLKNRSRARDFTRVLEQLWIENGYKVADDLSFIAGIDDDFCLAEEGTYGTVDGVTDDLIAQTERFDKGQRTTP
jgi:hypothetical protein